MASSDEAWADALTLHGLPFDLFSSSLPYDNDAISSTGIDLVPRLLDPTRPAGFRALISTDPITSVASLPSLTPSWSTSWTGLESRFNWSGTDHR